MAFRNTLDTHRWIIAVIRILGLAIFVYAFFEPAVRAEQTMVLSGWKCASIATSATLALVKQPNAGHQPFVQYLAMFSGWINPLIVLVILASPIRALFILRRIFGVIVVLCMIATWVLFAQEKIVPLTGHFLWIAGAVLVLVPETFPGRRAAGA